MPPSSIRKFASVLVCLALSSLALLALAAPEVGGKKYALLIGVNEYDHADLEKLDWAVNDVAELRDVLAKGGYEVVLLTAEEAKRNASLAPTKANFEAQLKAVVRKYAKGDTLLIGMAGHGLQFEDDEDGYFCPVNARPFQDYKGTLVSIQWVYERLKKDAASGVKLLLVDACRNLAKKPKIRSGINSRGVPPPPDGIGVLLSCKAGQTAQERDEYRHGVFFYHLLKGLKGEAKDRRGNVTWDSLRSYVKDEVPRDRQEQTPEEAGRLAGIPPVLLALGGNTPTPNPDTTLTNPAPPAKARTFLTEKDTYTAIRDHLRRTMRDDRKYQRYFTLTHLGNNKSVKDEDVRLHRAALSKTVNSLRGEKAAFAVPETVDATGVILVVDLRKLDWDRHELWTEVLKAYPYGLKNDRYPRDEAVNELAREVYELIGTDLPAVRADWFIATATRPPLYHTLLLKGGKEKDKQANFPDPVGPLARRYILGELGLEEAATELGLADPNILKGAILANDHLRRVGLGPLANGATIKREAWESRSRFNSPFQDAANAVERGTPKNYQ